MQRAGARGAVGGLGLVLIAAAVLSSPIALTGDADPALRTNPARDDLNLEFSRREIIKVDVEMALINVTVTDPIGRMVTGLDKEHFVLKEDSKPQVIEQFGAEEAPLSLAVVFDASGSMGYKMTKSREAVAQFFKTVNPEDEFFLVQFNNRPEMVTGFTRSLEEIQSRLTFVRSKGRTALLDAIYLALSQMKEAKNSQKALLVISDGGDNSSRYTPREIKRTVRESDVQIYAIGIYEPYASRGRTPEEAAGPGLLTEIAESTGGPAVRRAERERTTRYRREDRDRAAKPIRAGIHPREYAKRWEVASGEGRNQEDSWHAGATAVLPQRVLCADSIGSTALSDGGRFYPRP